MIHALLADSAPLRGLLTGRLPQTTAADAMWVLGGMLAGYAFCLSYIIRNASKPPEETDE